MANSTQRHEQPTRSYCTALAEKNLTIPEELEELAIVPIKRFYASPTVLSVCQSQRVLYRENGNRQRDAKPMAAQDCTVQATDEDGNYDTEEKQLLDHLSIEDDFQLLHGFIDMLLRAMFNLVIIDLPVGTIISIASSISAPPATHTRDRRTYSNNEDCKRGLPDVPDESRLFAIYNAIVTEVEEATRKLCINWCSHLYLACPWLGPPLLILTHTNKLAVDEVKQCKEQLLTTSEAIRSEIVNEIQQYSGEFSESAQPMIDFSIKEVKLFNSVDVFEFSNDLTERSNIENLKLPLENHCKSFKVVLARLWEKVIEFVNEQYTMSYISLSEVTKNLSSNGPQIILYNYHYAEEVEELKSISGVLFHHHHSCDEQWKQHCKGVIQCHVVYQQVIKELCIPLLYNDIAIRNVDLANAVLLSVHGLSPDGILSAAVRSEKSYQWWAQSISNAEILQYYRGLGALCSWTFCLATQLNAVIAQMKYAVSSSTVQTGNSNCLPPFTEQKGEENEMEPKAAARSEKIDQWWTQSINNAEILKRYQVLGALCSWTLCLATQLNAVITHVQRTAWYAACTRVESTETETDIESAPSPHTSPEVAGYIHSNELEWMFYPSRHGIYSAVPCPQPCDVLCYMADVQTDNPNPLPFHQNLESAVPSTTLTSPATAGRRVAASARGRVESAVLFDNQKIANNDDEAVTVPEEGVESNLADVDTEAATNKKKMEVTVFMSGNVFESVIEAVRVCITVELARWQKEKHAKLLLQCYLQSTNDSSYEKVGKMLAKYASRRWYTPDISELKQYLQAISADERFELLKKQYMLGDISLNVAAERGDTEVMRCLLELVEPQKRYKLLSIQGWWWVGTPFHVAASSGRTDVMKCMLKMVEPEIQIQLLDIPNWSNKTSLDVAKGEETVQLIRQYRASAVRETAGRWLRWLMDDEMNPLAFGYPPTEALLHWRQSNVNNNNPSAMMPSMVPDNLNWIFNPSLHGISSAVPPPPSYLTDVLCYAGGGHYTDTHNPLSFERQQELDEMSPHEYIAAIRNLFSEELTWLMSAETRRRKTFLDNWPHAGNISGEKMAQAGFYHSGDNDGSVRCVFCGVVIHSWDVNDNPMDEHTRYSSSCRFLQGLRSGIMKQSTVTVVMFGNDEMNPLAFGHPPTEDAIHWRQSNVNNNNPAMSYCEKLWDMLADYLCNPWHTLDTSVLKQYLQAISADVRFELLKKKNENGTTTIHEAAERGHTRVITALLEMVEPERRYELLKMQNRCGKPVLNVAAERGDARAMRCLLEQVEPGSVHELLKIRNESPFRYGFMYGTTAIEEAAWRGHTKVTNAMLAMVEPENQLELLDIPHWRVGGEKMAKVIHQYRRRAEFAVMEKLERLLAVYVYVPWSRLNTSELQQCLQAFSAGKRFELLKKQCGRGTTALHQAAKRGHTEVMRCLLKLIEARKRHELLKKQDVSSSTPLHAAARSAGTEAVRCMLELVELEDQVQLLNTPDWLSRTALDVAKGDKPTQIMRQCGESTAGKFRESPRRQRTATEGGCLLESHLHPTSRAFAMPCKDDANTLNEQISTGDPHHGERSHKVPMVEKAIEPTQVVREETTQATQEGREKSVLQQNALGDNTPVSLIPSNVVFQSDQSSLSLSESVPRPASTYQEEPSCSAPNVHGFQSSKIPSKQPLAGNHLKSVDCKLPSIGANILQDTKCGSSANERKYFTLTTAHSLLSENDVEWIFNPSRHGISSAILSYNREIACYPIARYPDNQNPLLPLSLQKKLAEMSPREYLSAVLRELSLEERESLMIDEKQRRNTFLVNWPHDSNLSGVKLAQAGFYCVDDYDRVQCVFCRGSLHKWEAEDNPMTEHAKLFPFCRFVKGLECGNKEYKNDLLLADELKNITLLTMPEMKKNRDGSVSTNSGAFGISTNKAAVIKYAPYETRKNTYGRWPAANVIRPEPLCEAGFYYTGFDDQVRCFFCSGGLREWSSEDNPWEEHARWFPDCSYLLQHKGEIYVTEVHARTEDGKKCPRKTVLQKKTEKEWKQKVSTQQAMYELIVVKLNHDRRAVDIAINRNGKTFESAKEMVEAVYQVEEDGNMDSDRMETDYQAIKPAIDFMAAAAKDQPIIVQEAAMGTDMVDGLQPGRMDTADSGPPPASCKTCYKKTSQVVQATQVGLPCGHLIYCDKCIQDEKLKTDRNNGYKSRCPAPQCAALLTGAIKAFLN